VKTAGAARAGGSIARRRRGAPTTGGSAAGPPALFLFLWPFCGGVRAWPCHVSASRAAEARLRLRRDKASLRSEAICRKGGLAFGGVEWGCEWTIKPVLYLLEPYYHLRFRYC